MSRKLTKETAIQWHRRMWNWIADTSLKEERKVTKAEFFQKYFTELYENDVDVPCNSCFCCEYASQLKGKYNSEEPKCIFCPLEWGSNLEYYMCLDTDKDDDLLGLFGEWDCLTDENYRDAAELARKIADLSEKDLSEFE